MPQEFQSSVRTYKYPFELVMKAYERRFPTCPQMPIVLDCVVIEDNIDGPKRHTKRRCKLKVEAPYILKKIVGIDVSFFIQENFLDMRERKLTIEATNETFSSRIKIFEKCRYYVHPENPQWTCFDQSANIEITNFFGFEHQMEKFGMKQYTQTTLKGKEIIEYFIEQLREEGITHVDIYDGESEECETENDNNKKDEGKEELKDDQQQRLNADYIKKYLGELTPLQESRLLQMRRRLEDMNLEKIPDYPTLLRFLRARDFSIDKATAMLSESLKWRKEHNVDNLLKEYKEPQVVVKYFPGAWEEKLTDEANRPIYIIKLGNIDVKGLLKSIGEDGLIKQTLYICEKGLKKMEEQTLNFEKPIRSWSLLVDCKNLSMRHLWRPGLASLFQIIEVVEKNYPETMGRVFIVRAPRVFAILWTIVSAFIDENTRNKFLFFDDEKGLEHFIPSMPNDFLAKSDKILIHNGGVIPKQLYKTESFDEHENADVERDEETDGDDMTVTRIKLNESNIYQNVKIRPGQFYEILIKNDDYKAVLTWDYESVKTEIIFNIFETSEDVDINVVNEDEFTSIFDAADLKQDIHYKQKETTTSRAKESVQGSLEMEKATYVLQWILPDTVTNESTRLMYFYETLSSVTYRGSMTSLQSQSAISLHSR